MADIISVWFLFKCQCFISQQITAQIDQTEAPNPERPPEEPPKDESTNQDDDEYSGGLC